MSYYSPQRKKIRGWKRRLRRLERWAKLINYPDLECFDIVGYTFERCSVYSYHLAQKRQPPLWFHKRIIDKLLGAYHNWMSVFNSMNVHYDLKLWVRYPTISHSEIICYKVDQPGEQKQVRSKIIQPTSLDNMVRLNDELAMFDWMITPEVDTYEEYEFDNANFKPEDLQADGYVRKQHGDDTVYYTKRLGKIWIGRLKML